METPRNRRHRLPPARLGLVVLTVLMLTATGCTGAGVQATADSATGTVNVSLGGNAMSAIQILVMLTVLSLAPALIMLVTSFTRIIIVLSFVRSALSVPTLPPNQVLIGLAIFMTLFVMTPVWEQVNANAVQPYLAGEIDQEVAFTEGMRPLRAFMFKQTREKDIELFLEMGRIPEVRSPDDIPNQVLIPAFIISELKTGFQMGFVLFIPFLIIDLVVSSVLMALGMMMLPPVVISLPFKILLFVMVDGWHLIVRSLLLSFA
jgi:flagellar biosynthetic protein FliP